MTDYRETLGISDLALETRDGEGVKVAVIDTGIPQIDDIFVSYACNLTSESASDEGHATFIGSMLFGKGPVHGICPQASAGFYKVFSRRAAKPETVARAILQAATSWKADIINLSLGFSRSMPCPESLKDACLKAHAAGVTLVASSGNDGGDVMWPAALPEVIGVGSSDGNDKSAFSNSGEIDFVSLGSELEGQSPDGNLTKKTGTSFSAAVITGLLALLLARRRRNGMDVTPDLLKADLIAECRDLGDRGWDPETGYGFPFLKTDEPMVNTTSRLRKDSIFGKIKSLIRTIVTTLTRRIHGNEQF